jgi:hypothetical protein
MKRYLLLVCMLLLGACASPNPSSDTTSPSTDAFQLHTGPDGRVYRIDSRTGKTSWLDGSTFREIAEPTMPVLVVGKVYRGEDGTSTFKYEGDGRFVKWALDRYLVAPQDIPTQK